MKINFPRGVLLIFCLCISTMAGDNVSTDPSALIQHALDVTDIWSQGPFHLHASVTIKTPAKDRTGQYDLYWVDKNKWRDQITLDGASALRIGIDRQIWSKPLSGAMAKLFLEVQHLINLPGYLMLLSHFTFEGRTSTKIGKTAAECLKLKERAVQIERQPCFETGSGLPLGRIGLHYDDFAEFGTKKFPRSMTYGGEDDWKVDLTVDKLVKALFPNPGMFAPPDQKHLKAGCFHVVAATPITKPVTRDVGDVQKFIKQVRKDGTTIWIVTTIDAHGAIKDQEIIGPPFFPQDMIRGIERHKYEPATCEGIPVESQTIETMIFGRIQ